MLVVVFLYCLSQGESNHEGFVSIGNYFQQLIKKGYRAMSNNCNHECNQVHCPFKTDPCDPYREVCVRCGKDHSFRRGRIPIVLMMRLITVIVLLMNNPNLENKTQVPETQSPSPSSQLRVN